MNFALQLIGFILIWYAVDMYRPPFCRVGTLPWGKAFKQLIVVIVAVLLIVSDRWATINFEVIVK